MQFRIGDFAALANSHIALRKVFVFEQCYSGVLLPMLEREGVLAISACSDNEPSRCSPNQLTDDFSFQFFSLAQTLSFAEAFTRASTMLSGSQRPRMSDTSGLAANFRICKPAPLVIKDRSAGKPRQRRTRLRHCPKFSKPTRPRCHGSFARIAAASASHRGDCASRVLAVLA